MSYTTAQIMMTLSAIAYVDDTGTPPETIGKKITEELKNASYATQGNWTLAWGPVVGAVHDNLAYIAQNGNEMAVVLRGTTPAWESIFEDIPSGQVHFPNAPSGATVSTEFLHDGLNELLAATAPTGSTLVNFLKLADPGTLYVTGHSQGGGLTPMMMAYLQDALSRTAYGHAFAPPTSGNPGFADWITALNTCTFYINPLDIVPLGYAAIGDIVSDGIPLDIPASEDGAEIAAAVAASVAAADAVGPWKQPETQVILPRVPIYPIIPGDPSFIDKFKAAVGDQHAHNNYLSLLGAPPVTL
ncbi:MAG: hypothetical protein AAFW87_09610 [Pseudomonadota bacterium]